MSTTVQRCLLALMPAANATPSLALRLEWDTFKCSKGVWEELAEMDNPW